jgi:hypothetical protein
VRVRAEVLPRAVPPRTVLPGSMPSGSLLQGELWLRCPELCGSDLRRPDLRGPRAELCGRPELRDGAELLRSQVLPRALLQGPVPPGSVLQGPLPSGSVPPLLPRGPLVRLRRLSRFERGRGRLRREARIRHCVSFRRQ